IVTICLHPGPPGTGGRNFQYGVVRICGTLVGRLEQCAALFGTERKPGRRRYVAGLAHVAGARLRTLSWRGTGRDGRPCARRVPEDDHEGRVSRNYDERAYRERYASVQHEPDDAEDLGGPVRVLERTLGRQDRTGALDGNRQVAEARPPWSTDA